MFRVSPVQIAQDCWTVSVHEQEWKQNIYTKTHTHTHTVLLACFHFFPKQPFQPYCLMPIRIPWKQQSVDVSGVCLFVYWRRIAPPSFQEYFLACGYLTREGLSVISRLAWERSLSLSFSRHPSLTHRGNGGCLRPNNVRNCDHVACSATEEIPPPPSPPPPPPTHTHEQTHV